MPRVPEYQPTAELRPANRQGVDVQSSARDFGSDVGGGMAALARGGMDVASAIEQVQKLDDTNRAKDRDNEYASWSRERMYGDNGFMTLQGRAAVDARKAFENEAEQKRKELGQGLTGGAAKDYFEASRTRREGLFNQAIVHTAGERKRWFEQTSNSRIASFGDDALVNFQRPELVAKNIAAGQAELREQGQMRGWDDATLKQQESDFVSGVYKNITLRMAQSDPLAANRYMKEHAGALTGAHQYDLQQKLATEIVAEQSKREADNIMSGARGFDAARGDPVAGAGAGAGAAPASKGGGRTVAASGPTQVRAFLIGKSGGQTQKIDGLQESFAVNLAAMLQDAPPEIRDGLGVFSGFRSVERQSELFSAAVSKYGSEKAARAWVAPPGHSNHNFGTAADLSFNGRSLRHAPANVVAWVHDNAKNYGLHFPLGNENWHVEQAGTRGGVGQSRVVARNDNVSVRAIMPSYADIESRLQAIADPKVRDATRTRLTAMMSMQTKAAEQQERSAKAELWSYIDRGATPDQVPADVRQLAGMAAVSSAWGYLDTAEKGRGAKTDETLLYDMRRFAAANPEKFADVDLNDYRDRLSKDAIKEMTDRQSSFLTDRRKASESGANLTQAFSQASTQLEAVGITATGKKGGAAQDAARRIAQFNNALTDEIETFQRTNKDRAPTQGEVQGMINKLLLPIVIKQERSTWNPLKTPWSSMSETPGFAFEARNRPDGTEVDVRAKITDIPIDLRRGIARDLARELGRKPSEEEVVTRYENFVTSR